jgi:hypothetical protein
LRIPLPALALLAVLAAGCAAARRGADDGLVVATTPIHVVTTPGAWFARGWEQDPLSTAASAPLFVPLCVAGDLFFTGISAADLALTPAYLPFKVRRPGLYEVKSFPPHLKEETLRDAGRFTGTTTVLLAPVAGFVAAGYGYGPWCPPPYYPVQSRNP